MASKLIVRDITDPREDIIAMFMFNDLPLRCLVYGSDLIARSMRIIDDIKGFGLIGLYAAHSREYGKPFESRVVVFERRADFLGIAREAVVKGAENKPYAEYNTRSLLRVLDELATLNP